MNSEQFKSMIQNIPDFPRKGIQFKDITTVLKHPECMQWVVDQTAAIYRDKGITQVVGLESRGFIFAPAIAMKIGAGFVPVRKPGKLPADTIEVSYTKEYGTDTIQLHKDALRPDDVVLIHDDLLATGGSALAAVELVKKAGVKKIYANFVIELDDLEARKLFKDIEVQSLIHY